MYASTSTYVVDSPQRKDRKDINFHNRKSFTVDCMTFSQSSMYLETCRTIVWGSLVTQTGNQHAENLWPTPRG